MLDKKSIIVLKALKKLLADSSYKVVTIQDIMLSLGQKKDFDTDDIKDIIDFLDKQDYINLKFSEDDTYCYSLLPKARIFLEQTKTKPNPSLELNFKQYTLIMLASLIGSLIALVLFFSLTT